MEVPLNKWGRLRKFVAREQRLACFTCRSSPQAPPSGVVAALYGVVPSKRGIPNSWQTILAIGADSGIPAIAALLRPRRSLILCNYSG